MTDNGSEERDPPEPNGPDLVMFRSDWERELWRDVYMTVSADPGRSWQAEGDADDAVRAVQARTKS